VLTDRPLSIYSVLGVFLLMGVVKKNAILQVDYTNHLRAQGMSRYDAQITADRVRLRPILMTTLTIIAGMLPIALGKGDGAAARASLATVVVGGQAMCLLITLLVTPVVYSFFDDLRGLRLGSFLPWRVWRLLRTRAAAASSVVVILLGVAQAHAHTVSELTKTPATFNHQPVIVVGEVANVVTRYGEPTYTTFEVVDNEERAVSVFILGTPPCKQGELCRVSGVFLAEGTVANHRLTLGIDADKVKKLSEAEYKTAGHLFRKKKRYGIKLPRGVYIPQ
jgi:hypothetical protein